MNKSGKIKILLLTTTLISGFASEVFAKSRDLTIDPIEAHKYYNYDQQGQRHHALIRSQDRVKHSKAYDAVKAETTRIHVTSIKIEGVDKEQNTKLHGMVAHLIGAKASVGVIDAEAKKIAKQLQSDGLLLAMAYVPEQSFAGGVVEIQVIEGGIRDVVTTGDQITSPVFQKYIDKILNMQPVNKKELVRCLLLMNKISGYQIEYDFKAIPTNEQNLTNGKVADLVIVVTRSYSKLTANLDNYGSKDLGKTQISLGSEFLSPFNQDESIFGFVGTSNKPNKLKSFTLGYERILNDNGTAISLIGSFSTNTPNPPPGTVEGAKNNNNSMVRAAMSNYPILTNKTSLLFEGGLQNNTQKSFNGNAKQSKDHILSLFVGSELQHKDRFNADNTITWTVFKAVNQASNVKMYDPALKKYSDSYTLFTGNVWRDQPLVGLTSLYVAANGQYSGAELPLSEKFSVGGTMNGRGYKSALVSANKGAGVTAEFRITKDDFAKNSMLVMIQPYAFYDVAGFAKAQAKSNVSRLASAGVGLRIGFTKESFFGFEVAKPMKKEIIIDNVATKNKTRYGFTFNKTFNW